jgi:hypothetical protein
MGSPIMVFLIYFLSGDEKLSREEIKKCVNCGIDMVIDAVPSKFDANYCEYCQDQENGAFESSKYTRVLDFIAVQYFGEVRQMKKDIAKANAELMIKNNPSFILKTPCAQ